MAREDENGLFWGSEIQIQPLQETGIRAPKIAPHETPQIPVIETTAYATLALNLHGDVFNASRATRGWYPNVMPWADMDQLRIRWLHCRR